VPKMSLSMRGSDRKLRSFKRPEATVRIGGLGNHAVGKTLQILRRPRRFSLHLGQVAG
jgi:hypothetical protein